MIQDTRYGRTLDPRQTLCGRAQLSLPHCSTGLQPVVSSRYSLRSLQQVRQTQLSLRLRRRPSIGLPGAEPFRQITPALRPQNLARASAPSCDRLPGDATPHRRSLRTGMATPPRKEKAGRLVLRRLIRYAEKVFALSSRLLDPVTDARQQPRTPTTLVLK